ncbi:MAG: DNA polymerase IV [Rhizobiaceae bacterium]
MAIQPNKTLAPKSICRDCLNGYAKFLKRCTKCGSPRMIYHEELDTLAIAHIDCDAFYASVEKRDNPDLQSKPVIIGGGRRGVVATCCYVARIRGVRSAMPMFKALEACPDAVVIKPNMEKYSKAGHQIRKMMRELTPMVEPLSIDEAFLDLNGTQNLHGASAAMVLARFVKRIETEIGITVSVGLSYCKFLAKVASDLEKPKGFSVVGEKEALSFLRKQSVSIVWGVGKVTQKMLAQEGITNLATVQDMEENELAKRFGSIGLHISRLSRGIDHRTIRPGSGAKSISSETTFNTDRSDLDDLSRVLRNLSEKIARRLKDKNIAGQTIVLKLKTTDFKSRTRSRQLTDPTQLADRIYRVGREMMAKELDGTKFRLLGIGVSSLRSDETADPADLIDIDATKRANVERAMDSVREKFGDKAVELGLTFREKKRD